MRLFYAKIIDKLDYEKCMALEKEHIKRWYDRHVKNAHLYGNQNGQNKPPTLALKRQYPHLEF